MIQIVLVGWLVLGVSLALLWSYQLRTKDATSVDVAWSFGLAILATGYAWFVDGDIGRRLLVGGLATVWALRLALFLLSDRVLKAKEEDGRQVISDKLTHQDLANMVGASREMVSRIMKDLADGGYIKAEGKKITIKEKLPPGW